MSSRVSAALLALLFSLSFTACGKGAIEESNAAGRLATLQEALKSNEYLRTPRGFYHRECIHAIDDGAKIDNSNPDETVITLKDGGKRKIKACGYPNFPSDGYAPVANGWIEAAQYTAPSRIEKMTARWTVPPIPAQSGSLIYLFPGIEPSSGSLILQPVLQYGYGAGGGGDYWAIESWYCGASCFHSDLRAVNAGDVLDGSMVSSNCTTKKGCNWNITTTDRTTGASTILNVGGVTQTFTWAFGGALEAYYLSSCTQYPQDPTTFTNLSVSGAKGRAFAPTWGTWKWPVDPACSYGVNLPGPSQVALTY
jgi:hypothetical protein